MTIDYEKIASDIVCDIVKEEYKTGAKEFKREILVGRGQVPEYPIPTDFCSDFYYALEKVLDENDYVLTRYSYSNSDSTKPITFQCNTKY